MPAARLLKFTLSGIFALFISMALSHFSPANAGPKAEPTFFDEIFTNPKTGKVYPWYETAYNWWNKLTEKQKKLHVDQSRKQFMGDNALEPMPRIIPAEEYDRVLKPGVEQRAQAIVAFLQDHYSGRRTYADAGVIPQEVVDRIVRRGNDHFFDQSLRGMKNINFMYGPDIIRDSKGTWRVIEDNPGFIGGVGDLRLAQELTLKMIPGLNEEQRFRPATEFYEELATRFQSRGLPGRVVLYQLPPYADNEDKRIRALLHEMGISVVTNHSQEYMQITEDGVFLRNKRNPGFKQKVSFVMLNGEHHFMDSSFEGNFQKAVIMEAKAHLEEDNLNKEIRKELVAELAQAEPNTELLMGILNRSNILNSARKDISRTKQASGLIQAILDGKVNSNYSPGIDFIGDKEFYVYVENLIRFYLKQEPILRNIETGKFGDERGRLNQKLFDKVFANLNDYVIKKVDGRGGDAVWVGPKISAKEIPAIQERILEAPGYYIFQRFTPLSRLNDLIVDIRVIADVNNKDVFVSNTPWGRGLPVDGNGKVNLSDTGREVTVLVTEGPFRLCKNAYSLPIPLRH